MTEPTVQTRLWIWHGHGEVGQSTVLAVLVKIDAERLGYRPLIAGSEEQAEEQAPLAHAAAADLGLSPILAEYELVALHTVEETP